MLNGIDISNWQRGIDLSKVPADFVIIKATGGTGYVSDQCDIQFQQAKALGKPRGVYHFAGDGYRDLGPEREADFFIENTLGYHDGETILVLDWEADALPRGPRWAKAWMDRVYQKTGIKPIIYMSASVSGEYDWSEVVKADYGLWVAAYAHMNIINGYQKPTPPAVGHWPFVAIFQYSSTTRLPGFGGDLDANVAYLDRAGWMAYAAINGKVASPPTKPPAAKKTTDEVAREVIDNKWGKGKDREIALTKAGYNYATVQARVNEILGYTGAPKTHTVRAGENLSVIAAQYGTTWQELARINAISNPNLIQVGQKVRVA